MVKSLVMIIQRFESFFRILMLNNFLILFINEKL